ncbi:MAG: murein hydrolase activator EnvC family protein [Culicoidibacterales bacterium]
MMKKIITSGCILSLFMLTPSFQIQACDTVNSCDEQLSEIASQKQQQEATISAYKNDDKNLSTKIETLKERISSTESEIRILDDNILLLKSQIIEVEESIRQKEELIMNRLVAQQKQNNSNTFLAILVSSDSITDLIKRWNALDLLNKQDKHIMTDLALDRVKLVELQKASQAKQDSLQKVKIELEADKTESEAAINQMRELLDRAEVEMLGYIQIEADLNSQREILNRPKPTPPPPGGESPIPNGAGWTLPLEGAVVTTQYMSPIYQMEYGRTHPALDIGKYEGAPLYAVAEGWVIMSGWNTLMGNVVAISHVVDGENYVSFYAHMDSRSVVAGDYISGGQRVGAMGNTGTASFGPHLHFELYRGRSEFTYDKSIREKYSVDPLLYFSWRDSWSLGKDSY